MPLTAWYLAAAKPNSTAVAKRHLRRQGFESFVPLDRVTRRERGHFVSINRPYFHNYIFVGDTAGAAPIRAIRSTQGISCLITFDAKPARVPVHLIEDLRARCDEEGCIRVNQLLEPGDKVRVTNGPFTDLIAQVDRLPARERAWVLLDILSLRTRVELPLESLAPAVS